MKVGGRVIQVKTVEVVIRLPEKTYRKILSNEYDYGDMNVIIQAGTPLPQPFDLKGLKSDMKALNCGYPYGLDYLLDCLKKRLGLTLIDTEKRG